jgi:23S rRNA (cytosine1962-C5)-methyltransferase
MTTALAEEIRRAAVLRETFPIGPAGAVRLYHGDAEGVRGIRLDRYGAHLRLEIFDPLTGGAAAKERLLDGVESLLPAGGTLFLLERYLGHGGPIPMRGPQSDGVVVIEEGNVRFRVELARARNTGLFLDTRAARRWLAELAVAGPVLNLFAYTCAFGVVARLAGARHTVNVDMSRTALARGAANYALNGLDAPSRTFLRGDIRKRLPWLARRHFRFELIIVDPPPTAPIPPAHRLRPLLADGGRILWCHHGSGPPPLPDGFTVVEERPPDPDFPGPSVTRSFLLEPDR